MNLFQTDVLARNALEAIIQERIRQTMVEGYTLAHDDEHTEGQLALLAAAYALSSRYPGHSGYYDDSVSLSTQELPFELRMVLEVLQTYNWSFNPKDPIRDLSRAGALIMAELERLLRAKRAEECGEQAIPIGEGSHGTS